MLSREEIRNIVINAGYLDKWIGTEIEKTYSIKEDRKELINAVYGSDIIPKVQELLKDEGTTDKVSVLSAFKYVVIDEHDPKRLGSRLFTVEDGEYYTQWFWKIDL